jgi:nucleoid-associated protein YgaU
MKRLIAVTGVMMLIAAVAGCTAVTKPAAPPDQEYILKAQAFESEGDPVEALKMYRLALAANPKSAAARERIPVLEAKLKELAENHYQDGMVLYRKGRYAEARKEFLIALQYDPEQAQAQQMTGEQEAVKGVEGYVLHTVQPNESLSLLANRYYGDYKKFHLIARFNRLDDARRITVGQVIKVPIVEGVPFLAEGGGIVSAGEKPGGKKTEGVSTTQRFIAHTIRPGESLWQLAAQYYGDHQYSEVIARYNGLNDPRNIRVGQEIKIPEIEGVPFLVKETQSEATRATAAEETAKPSPAATQEPETAAVPAAQLKPTPVRPEAPKPPTPPAEQSSPIVSAPQAPKPLPMPVAEPKPPKVPQPPAAEPLIKEGKSLSVEEVAAHRQQGIDFYKNRNYAAAIDEFQQVLGATPDDPTAKRYMGFAYYEQGMRFYQNQEYLQAVGSLKTALTYDSRCGQCRAYIEKSEEAFKELFYRRGLDYFKAEKLEDAIRQWEAVYDMDPGYKDVKSSLQKARQLQQRLQEVESSRKAVGN